MKQQQQQAAPAAAATLAGVITIALRLWLS